MNLKICFGLSPETTKFPLETNSRYLSRRLYLIVSNSMNSIIVNLTFHLELSFSIWDHLVMATTAKFCCGEFIDKDRQHRLICWLSWPMQLTLVGIFLLNFLPPPPHPYIPISIRHDHFFPAFSYVILSIVSVFTEFFACIFFKILFEKAHIFSLS